MAILSREASLILIPLILLYHWIFQEKIRVGRIAPLIVLTIMYAVLRPYAASEEITTTLLHRLPGFKEQADRVLAGMVYSGLAARIQPISFECLHGGTLAILAVYWGLYDHRVGVLQTF
jgi:hypothetical protein